MAKKQILLRDASAKIKLAILEDYQEGMNLPNLCKKYNVSKHNMDKYIGNTCKKLNIVRQSNALSRALRVEEKSGKSAVVSWIDPENINKDFLTALSGDEDLVLSESEQTYCIIYSNTGNNKKAIKAAGLDCGLKTKEHVQNTVDHAIMIRGLYLRQKPTIVAAIKLLQEQNLKELNINKSYVQINIVQNIEELKEEVVDDPRMRGHLLKAIEMLGKTTGAFQENIRITQIDPAATLDAMIEMAETAKGKYEQESLDSGAVEGDTTI